MNRYSKYRFKPDLDYKARYTINKFNAAGDVVTSHTLTIEIPGKWLIRYGVNNTISYYAKKHEIDPDSYVCDILED